MKKLSQWFAGSVAPVRQGVYETIPVGGVPWFARWDGHQWMVGDWTPELASVESEPTNEMNRNGSKWRGLAKEPK